MPSFKKSTYRYCLVPHCTNTSFNSSEKLFFSVPRDPVKRKAWTTAMKRDEVNNPKLANTSSLWCCEDHFSLQDDMENYWQWKLRKDVKKFQLKEGTIPHIFECQKENNQSSVKKKAVTKRKCMYLVQEALPSLESSTSVCTFPSESPELPENLKSEKSSQEQGTNRRPSRRAAQIAAEKIYSIAQKNLLVEDDLQNASAAPLNPPKIPITFPPNQKHKNLLCHNIKPKKDPPEIDLLMECEEELLSYVQGKALWKAQSEYNMVMKTLQSLKASNARIIFSAVEAMPAANPDCQNAASSANSNKYKGSIYITPVNIDTFPMKLTSVVKSESFE